MIEDFCLCSLCRFKVESALICVNQRLRNKICLCYKFSKMSMKII